MLNKYIAQADKSMIFVIASVDKCARLGDCMKNFLKGDIS